MSHVDDGTLHALVDNELDAAERSVVEAHLASCGDCARRFAEATAMARQVVSLLGALDAHAGAVRIVTPAVAPAVADVAPPKARTDATVIPMFSRFRTVRRVAVAASVLVVAGVSYQVGRTRDAAPNEPAVSMVMADRASRPLVTPSVVDAMPGSDIAESAPAAQQKPRNGPRNDSEMSPADRPEGAGGGARDEADSKATGSAVAAPAAPRAIIVPLPVVSVGESSKDSTTQRRADAEARSRESADALSRVQAQESARAQQAAPAQSGPSRIASQRRMELGQVVVTGVAATADSSANVADGKAAPAKATPLAGYTALEDESLPSLTRRRYVSANGTPIVLLIIKPPTEQKRTPPPETESSFVVFSTNGTSSVRWRARGRDYELQGPLAPDSLLKLAARLK
ncbi:MAG: zf-HC2 domain-containing protein [Gemmatimonadaceae bacterium]|nr:zf-HC2 domain-containing protein [Gemmatimonadaceae bacterium]